MIENEHIRFERTYNFRKDSDLIDFNTRLVVKATDEKIENSVVLYALQKEKFQKLLNEAGFEIVTLCGNFSGEPFKETGLPLIATCRKS